MNEHNVKLYNYYKDNIFQFHVITDDVGRKEEELCFSKLGAGEQIFEL